MACTCSATPASSRPVVTVPETTTSSRSSTDCPCPKITFADEGLGLVDCCRCTCQGCRYGTLDGQATVFLASVSRILPRCNEHLPARLQSAAFEPNLQGTVPLAATSQLRQPEAKQALMGASRALALQVCGDGRVLIQLPISKGMRNNSLSLCYACPETRCALRSCPCSGGVLLETEEFSPYDALCFS